MPAAPLASSDKIPSIVGAMYPSDPLFGQSLKALFKLIDPQMTASGMPPVALKLINKFCDCLARDVQNHGSFPTISSVYDVLPEYVNNHECWRPVILEYLSRIRWIFVEQVTPKRWRVYCAFNYDSNLSDITNRVYTGLAKSYGFVLARAEQIRLYLDHVIEDTDGQRQRICIFSCKRRGPDRTPYEVMHRRRKEDYERERRVFMVTHKLRSANMKAFLKTSRT